ncbi:hypothetical protein MYCTH_2090061 [Thermothelomyces thermophilus ATCC 42464]|uniref:CN hydrolase domain-containing protein n=1 Tax=Thermothelomyces thermophilus (strain ATCC 42464 / BCRC 31852 / DSM 1799) TaxID=573729 RepID=G2Q7X1_THET4|nr:uncharacterized protein MYCTH_2090061 [Thermothelomyces thermophilus ATCC 42464]AEO56128.1 hypothetical protein MYCTH_2090061 [Thermothelomyces thermophilus ATCC 42464]
MRIGCLQFAPKVGDVTNNIAQAEAVLSSADQDELKNLDLLVLPEMAFSEPENYNSLIVVDRDGETLANYSKSFLYYTDATWAREGRGFYGGKLGDLGQTAMGICTPYKFEAPWDAYEFAFHILRVRANLVILSTAWLTNDERTGFLACPDAPDLYTLTYWAQRLEPVIRTGASEETVVVFANRSGVEDEATYAGTSTVLGIRDGQVSVYGILGRGVEELLVVDTDKPPLGRLVYRPAVPGDGSPTQTSALPTTASRRRLTAAKAAGAEHKPAGSTHPRPKLTLQTDLPRLRTPPAASAELDPTGHGPSASHCRRRSPFSSTTPAARPTTPPSRSRAFRHGGGGGPRCRLLPAAAR